jgi:hypothetical protein
VRCDLVLRCVDKLDLALKTGVVRAHGCGEGGALGSPLHTLSSLSLSLSLLLTFPWLPLCVPRCLWCRWLAAAYALRCGGQQAVRGWSCGLDQVGDRQCRPCGLVSMLRRRRPWTTWCRAIDTSEAV